MSAEKPNFIYKEFTKQNLKELTQLNSIVLPIVCPPTFYNELIKQNIKGLTQLAYVEDELIGAISCRIEKLKNCESKNSLKGTEVGPISNNKINRVYIMTLAVRAKYQNQGVGRNLLELVLNVINQRNDIADIYLHVQTSNKIAINLYKKFGFDTTEMIRNFYRRIAHPPPHCYVLSLSIPFILPSATNLSISPPIPSSTPIFTPTTSSVNGASQLTTVTSELGVEGHREKKKKRKRFDG